MRKGTILLIDDNESFRTSLRKVLEKENYQVIEAGDGKKGTQLVSEQNLDLIILDYYLGDMTGADFLSGLRSELKASVILLSANLNPDMDQEMRGLGAQILLSKPVSRRDLLQAVQMASNTNREK